MKVNHKQLKELLRVGFNKKVPLDIKGPVGIGKSELTLEVAKDIAKEQKRTFKFWNRLQIEEKEEFVTNPELVKESFLFADLRLSQFDQTDLKGFPITSKDYAKWNPTLLFKITSNEDAVGMIFLDELNLASPSVTASAYQVVNDNLVGETPISKGIYIVSAGNRLDDTNNAFDDAPPLNNRRMNVELEPPSIDEWITWAGTNGVDARIIAYLQWKQSCLYKYDDDSVDPSFPTPRMWTKASKLISGITDYTSLKMFVGACVGDAYGRELVAFIKLTEKVNVKDMLTNPKLIKKYSGPEHIDIKYSIISGIVELFKQNNKILNNCLGICMYMEPEYSMFLLRLMKTHDEQKFRKNLLNCSNWAKIAPEYAKYMLGD